MSVSNHAVSLSATDYDRYLQKLKLRLGDNIINLPDPYNLSDGLHTDPDKLSPFSTTWTFIASPFYNGDALCVYKSLNAYN